MFSDEFLNADLRIFLDSVKTLKRKSGKTVLDENSKPSLTKVMPTIEIVSEVREAIPSCGVLIKNDQNTPFWLDGRDNLKPTELVVCRNGILHVPTGELSPPNPLLFAQNTLDFDYEAGAGAKPDLWLEFLHQLWPDDPESLQALKAWFGYCLTADTSLQKILLLVGPKRAGKGTIARIQAALLGQANVAGPTLGSLGTNFGLQPLLDKPLAIISDARLSGRTDQAIVVERLLSISGEDLMTIDRKYQPPIAVRLPTRIMLMTNELPRLADTSGALAGRFIVLKLIESFYSKEDPKLANKLIRELPAILNWALQGLHALRLMGVFGQPKTATDAIEDLDDLSSPIGAFVRDRCVVGPGYRVPVQGLFDEYRMWGSMQGRTHTVTAQTFSRDLKAAVPGIVTKQGRDGDKRPRYFAGIGLKNKDSQCSSIFS